jgi:WD40 repeat protein
MHDKTNVLRLFFFLFFVTTNVFAVITNTIQVIDQPIVVLNSRSNRITGGAAFLLNDKTIISVNGYPEINIWERDNGSHQSVFYDFGKKIWQRNVPIIFFRNDQYSWHFFSVAAISSDGKGIAVSGSKGDIEFWDVKTLCFAPEQSLFPAAILSGHTDFISSLKFTPSGMILSASWDHTIKLWGYDFLQKKILSNTFAGLCPI